MKVKLNTGSVAIVDAVCNNQQEQSLIPPHHGCVRVKVHVTKASKYHREGDVLIVDITWKQLTRWLLRGHEVPVT